MKHDEGVVVDAVGGEPVDDRPDAAVDRRDHGRVDAGARVLDVGDGLHVLAGRLQGVWGALYERTRKNGASPPAWRSMNSTAPSVNTSVR